MFYDWATLGINGATSNKEAALSFTPLQGNATGRKLDKVSLFVTIGTDTQTPATTQNDLYAVVSFKSLAAIGTTPLDMNNTEYILAAGKLIEVDVGVDGAANGVVSVKRLEVTIEDFKNKFFTNELFLYIFSNGAVLDTFSQLMFVACKIDYEMVVLKDSELLKILQLQN